MFNFNQWVTRAILVTGLVLPSIAQAIVGYIDFIEDGVDIERFNCVQSVTSTSDGRWVYGFSFCDHSIVIFERDFQTGLLTFVDRIDNDESTSEEGISPSDIGFVSPDDRNLYVWGRTSEGGDFRTAMFVFDIDLQTGLLTQRQIFEDISTDNINIAMLSSGNIIYVGGGNGRLEIIGRSGNGQLALLDSLDAEEISNTGSSREVLRDLHLTPDERRLYISTNGNKLIWFDIDESSGALAFVDQVDDSDFTSDLWGTIADFVISPEGTDLYGFTINDVFVHLRLDQNGIPSLGSISDELPDNHNNSEFVCPFDPVISENGRLFYVIDACSGDLQVWGREPLDGALAFFGLQVEADGLFEPRFFSQGNQVLFSNDGQYIYAAMDDGIAIVDVTVDTHFMGNFPASVSVGEVFTAELEVENNGPADSHRVTVDIDLNGLMVSDAAISGINTDCQIMASQVFCELDQLVLGAAEIITLDLVAPDSSQQIVISAEVSQDQIDIESSNNRIESLIDIVETPDATPTPTPTLTPTLTPTITPSPAPTSTATPNPAPTSVPAQDDEDGEGGGGSFDIRLVFGMVMILISVLVRRRYQ